MFVGVLCVCMCVCVCVKLGSLTLIGKGQKGVCSIGGWTLIPRQVSPAKKAWAGPSPNASKFREKMAGIS
jgi:hypothetical protein